ncbi:MAG TPA: MupA/Atu3671 family FMN-dependent luciferase-like monooxygenase, partial [Verrucomicrobiae bacterium]
SKGRAAISVAWGWHANDFVFAPENYPTRRETMLRNLEIIRRLWRGETVPLPGGNKDIVPVKLYPPPIQRELPLWITSSGDPETFRQAGEMGLNVLTHLSGQSQEQLAGKIELYRNTRRQHGHAGRGHVSLMLHTYLGENMEEVWQTVRQPLYEYLKTYRNLASAGATETAAQHGSGNGDTKRTAGPTEGDLERMLGDAVERYFQTSGLFGTTDTCRERIQQLRAIGVDEVACLIDFGIPTEKVLNSLKHVVKLKEETSKRTAPARSYSIPDQILHHGVTHFQCTPSLANMLLQDPEAAPALGRIKKMMLGGEAFPLALADQLKIVPEVINMYGPTETTIWSSTGPVEKAGASIPIGRPIANTQIYIVDKKFQPTPIGVPGELLIGGAGVVRGYLNRPELTEERFIENPFQPNHSRLYRTGDLARYLPDGRIEFLGRLDHQVKLRGFRIELGEIEAALREYRGVRECVVVLKEFAADDKRLVAYLVLEGTDKLSPVEVRKFLKERLPEYMVPSSYVTLKELPLTPNGKIDRKALPAPEGMRQRTETPYIAAETSIEKTVAQIFQQLLRVEKVGLNDNFFELGGHSLLLVQAHARLCEALNVEFPVIRMFQHSTIAALTKHLGETCAAHQEIKAPKPSFNAVQERARRQRQSFSAGTIQTQTSNL